MRNISFSMTTDQILNQFKTVTRRLGWKFLKVGDVLQPIEKGQGLKKGEKVKRIGPPIRVVDVRREALMAISYQDILREGFTFDRLAFIEMFCKANKCNPHTIITRIEFEYLNATTRSEQ